jgi:hypothetical protein
MGFLNFIVNTIKCGQLVGFSLIFYNTIKQPSFSNLQIIIIISYLFLFSMIIFFTICFKSLFKTFPFLDHPLKLTFTLFLMSGYSFGNSIFEMRNLISLILLGSSIFFFVLFYLFLDKYQTDKNLEDNFKEKKVVKIDDKNIEKIFENDKKDSEKIYIKINEVCNKNPDIKDTSMIKSN